MRANIDFTPLRRATVGFDRLFSMIEAGLGNDEGYPPFDIVRSGEDSYRITLAVAGFKPDQIEVTAQHGQLIVTGSRPEDEGPSVDYLHRGIAARPFERRFQLAEYVQVGEATLADGLLTVQLNRVVPEALKPRKIEIGTGQAPQLTEQREAA